ncbi:uncharacterized protein LOC124942932 [Impatiens glandulifera]|uniref:uncharacterized protein LOC124942932 n=1 Tax=Impatiens glandulifera TaxID=253017 RepID=UPI001FB12825|nr:uncharacterized protein LOC124942932 [Impatiens glandulifera]
MKLSLKLQDQNNPKLQNPTPVFLRAKVPISIFGLPFLSSIAATDNSDVSLSLSTNFSSGPSLKLSYTPTTPSGIAAATTTSSPPPLNVTLKSGVGIFGSPRDSPLILSAQFSVNPSNPNPNPTFFLQIKPQFGNFSLRKTSHSTSDPPKKKVDNSFGFVPLERPSPWNELAMEYPYKECLLSGIAVTARTELPVTKRLSMSFRWGVNFPDDVKKQLPFLTVKKVCLQRIDIDQTKEIKMKPNEEKTSDDIPLLKELFLSTKRELEILQSYNREMMWVLEEMKTGSSQNQTVAAAMKGNHRIKSSIPLREKGGCVDLNSGKKEDIKKKNIDRQSDVESELQKAIKASSS